MNTDSSKLQLKISRDESIAWKIKAIGSWLDQQLKIGLEPLGLSSGQFAILMALFEEDGLTQVELGNRIYMPGYATSRNMDELEDRGLAIRRPHESSRRSYRVFTTPAGRDLAEPLTDIILSMRASMHESCNAEEMQTLNHLLNKMVRRLVDE